MPRFALLQHKIENGDVWVDEYDVPEAYDIDSSEGVSITPVHEQTRLLYKNRSARKTDYVAGIFSFPVVSRKFAELLELLHEGHLEYLPVRLVCRRTGDADETYFLLNILDNVPCFDWEKSRYEETLPGGTPFGITKFSIREAELEKRNIARIAEIPSLILVSDLLRKKIEEQALTGVEFKELAEYSDLELP